MYKTKKEIEKWIKAFNQEQVERMKADNYMDYIDEEDLNGNGVVDEGETDPTRINDEGDWDGDGIEPSKKDKKKEHKILKFPKLQSSGSAYMKNLNTHRGYKEFRNERAEIRKKNQNIKGIDLVEYLYNYAQTGSEYVKTLKKIIQQNDLTDFDNSVLMNSSRSKSLTL